MLLIIFTPAYNLGMNSKHDLHYTIRLTEDVSFSYFSLSICHIYNKFGTVVLVYCHGVAIKTMHVVQATMRNECISFQQ
jgi:hypothetical protein